MIPDGQFAILLTSGPLFKTVLDPGDLSVAQKHRRMSFLDPSIHHCYIIVINIAKFVQNVARTTLVRLIIAGDTKVTLSFIFIVAPLSNSAWLKLRFQES